MWFVYLHIAWFSIRIALGVEYYPYGLLTMIVSLEAIFLSTFVMISQNRQDETRRHMADQEWGMVQTEEQHNAELIGLSNQILDLTKTIHELSGARARVGRSACGFKVRDDLLNLPRCRRGSCRLEGSEVRYEPAPSVVWQS
jgi:uncharacterized membrane protein